MRDATLSAPALNAVRPARSAPGSRAGSTSRSRKRPGTRRLPARLSVIVGSAGFCAIMIGIVINATMFQKGHHPAPLFASAAPLRPVAAEPPPAVIPLTVPPPVAAVPEVETRPIPTVTAELKAGPGHALPAKGAARHVDGIARLLGRLEPARAGKPNAAPHAKAAPAKPATPLVN